METNDQNFNRIDFLNKIKAGILHQSNLAQNDHPFDKKSLWNCFKEEFFEQHDKPFEYDDRVINNIKPIFYYFLGSEKFYGCTNLRSDLSAPSFKKGLLLIGPIGSGKTKIMKVFEKIFNKYKPHRFKIYTTIDLVDKFESYNNQGDISHFKEIHTLGTVMYDDLNAERIANNYGAINIMYEILFKRHDRNKKTHLTLNQIDGFENDILKTLEILAQKYDARLIDRFFEMFNIIEFKGESLRR